MPAWAIALLWVFGTLAVGAVLGKLFDSLKRIEGDLGRALEHLDRMKRKADP